MLQGKLSLPSEERMMEDVERKLRSMRQRYRDTPRYRLRVDYIPYADELAALIGCKPDLGKASVIYKKISKFTFSQKTEKKADKCMFAEDPLSGDLWS